jgi:hypothetical protein
VTFFKPRAVPVALIAFAAMVLGSCTVKETEAPSLAGPSETGLSVASSVSPDILDQDGLSQAVVEVVTRGPDGRPVGSIPLRIEIFRLGGAAPEDFGRLSNKTPVTGSDGVARVTYTAPPAPSEPVDSGVNIVTLAISPVGGDFHGADPRYVQLRLVPKGVLLPPNGAPQPSFIITPQPVFTRTPVTFDASGTRDEGVQCGSRCIYSWDFGDGSSGTGMAVSHEFNNPATYVVRLTVTDARGQSVTTAQSVTVEATPAPTAEFTYSPGAPKAGQDIFFNAQASLAAPGHTLVAYDWDFGSGRTGTGVTVAKRYDTPATYNVTLKVHDDTFSPGGTAVITKAVTVAAP